MTEASIDGVVKRLRAAFDDSLQWYAARHEAADAIEAMQAEVIRLVNREVIATNAMREMARHPCRHTRTAEQETERADLKAWQKDRSEWFDATILEIVTEYAVWRDEVEQLRAKDERLGMLPGLVMLALTFALLAFAICGARSGHEVARQPTDPFVMIGVLP